MDNIYKKIETELSTLSSKEKEEILSKLRDGMDDIDKQIVSLLSKRTLHSVLIGRVKRSMNLPTYNPKREKEIAERISSYVEEPLRKDVLLRIYERILDESRAIQREEMDKGNIFNISTEKMKIGMGKLLSKKEVFIVAIFFLFVLTIMYLTFFTPNYYMGQAPIKVEIRKGEALSDISNDLYSKGVIPGKTNFKIAAFIYGAERKIKAARYYIPNGLSYLDLIDYLVDGKGDLLKSVVIIPGSSLNMVASTLSSDVFTDSTEILKLSRKKDFLDSLGVKAPSLLGYILPRKYDIYERSSPNEVLKELFRGFQNFMTDSLKQRAKKLGYSVQQIVTLASIIEGETNKKSEMPVIAGVYYNRLKSGIKLQADPTVEFAKQGQWGRLNYNDLKIKSAYNTYIIYGLPPGAINNPDKAAILAALYPNKNNYMYFAADGSGGHSFSSNYQEHLQNADKYRKWLDSKGK
ncbi:MAG: endolytic transglycosylase MltG [Ignavibacteriaceae bacterium]|jgi:UPF0755 protein